MSSSLVPKNGAVVVGGLTMDFSSFDIDSSQAVENVTPYGANVNTKNVGSGTPDISINIGAFALAHGASTAPLLGTLPGGATGAATTLTLDTGITEACGLVISSLKISHGRMKAAVPVSISGKNAGDLTETWATS